VFTQFRLRLVLPSGQLQLYASKTQLFETAKLASNRTARNRSPPPLHRCRKAFNKNPLFTSQLDLRNTLVKCYIWSTAWTLRKVDQKYLEIFEMRCWRRTEKASWTDHVRNEKGLHGVKEEGNILHIIKRRKADSIGHILRRNCVLKHSI
jgi:hypothetical protein